VPSNTISKELAEKIRNRYFPKTAPDAPRAIRVIKHAPSPSPLSSSTTALPSQAPAQSQRDTDAPLKVHGAIRLLRTTCP
jgi:hypothetical protein